MRTLVVEDDTAVVEALRESFQDSGLDIDYATDGESALKKIPEVDLLVTDLRLPGMDGTELLKEARRRKPEIEVVVMTAYGTIPSAVEAMRRGARAYLTKPFDPEELVFHIRTVEETAETEGNGLSLLPRGARGLQPLDAKGLSGDRFGRGFRLSRINHGRNRHRKGASRARYS